jgi:hypothetical protein
MRQLVGPNVPLELPTRSLRHRPLRKPQLQHLTQEHLHLLPGGARDSLPRDTPRCIVERHRLHSTIVRLAGVLEPNQCNLRRPKSGQRLRQTAPAWLIDTGWAARVLKKRVSVNHGRAPRGAWADCPRPAGHAAHKFVRSDSRPSAAGRASARLWTNEHGVPRSSGPAITLVRLLVQRNRATWPQAPRGPTRTTTARSSAPGRRVSRSGGSRPRTVRAPAHVTARASTEAGTRCLPARLRPSALQVVGGDSQIRPVHQSHDAELVLLAPGRLVRRGTVGATGKHPSRTSAGCAGGSMPSRW